MGDCFTLNSMLNVKYQAKNENEYLCDGSILTVYKILFRLTDNGPWITYTHIQTTRNMQNTVGLFNKQVLYRCLYSQETEYIL